MPHRHRKSHPKPTRARRRRTAGGLVRGAAGGSAHDHGDLCPAGRSLDPGDGRAVDAHPNFDVRLFKQDPRLAENEAAAEFMTSVAPAPALAADLAADRGSPAWPSSRRPTRASPSRTAPALGGIEVVSTAPGAGFLTPPSGDRVGTLRGFLSANADAYGISPARTSPSCELVADYMNPAGNMGWAEFEQTHQRHPRLPGRDSRRLHRQGRAGADDRRPGLGR